MRYARIAAHAQALGRPRLATLLLEHETRAGEQVFFVNKNVLALSQRERSFARQRPPLMTLLLQHETQAVWQVRTRFHGSLELWRQPCR